MKFCLFRREVPVLSFQPLDVVVCFILPGYHLYTSPWIQGRRQPQRSQVAFPWISYSSICINCHSFSIRFLVVGRVGHFYRDIRVRTGPFTAWTRSSEDWLRASMPLSSCLHYRAV